MIQHHNIGATIGGGQGGTRRNAAIHANDQRSAGIAKCCKQKHT